MYNKIDEFGEIKPITILSSSLLKGTINDTFFNEKKFTIKEKEFSIKVLDKDYDVQNLLNLQTKAMSELPKGTLVEKTAEDFKKLKDLKNGLTVAIFDHEKKHIAQVSIGLENLKNSNIYHPNIIKGINIDYIFEIRGTIVNSEYNGLNLSKHLIDFALEKVEELKNGNILITAEIASSNSKNMYIKLRDGFKALKKYVASDGVECYLFYKPIGSFSEKHKFSALNSMLKFSKSADGKPMVIKNEQSCCIVL